MKQLGMIFLMGYALSGGVAHAATYYVSRSGSDASSCAQATNSSAPKQTLKAALPCLAAGDTLYVRGGTYPESLENPPVASGTSWSNKVRIAAYPGETVWLASPATNFAILFDINQSYIEIDGINVDGRNALLGVVVIGFHNPFPAQPHHIRIQNAEILNVPGGVGSYAKNGIELAAKTPIVTGGIELRYLKIHGNGRPGSANSDNGYGIYVAAPNTLVEYSDIYDNKGCEMQIYNDDGAIPDNNIIRNNVFHDQTRLGAGPGGCGILIAGSGNQIYNNVFYNIRPGPSDGVSIYGYVGNANKIWNNTSYNNTGGIQLAGGMSNTEVRNNIAYSNGFDWSNAGSATVQSNNLFGVNPLFANAGAGDFHLQSSSPARNTGLTIASVTTDMIGTMRPQEGIADIGAIEFQGSVSTPAAPTAPTGLRILY